MLNINELPAAAILLNRDLVITDINHYALCHQLDRSIQINRSIFEIQVIDRSVKEAIIRSHQNNIDISLEWTQHPHPIVLKSPSIINDSTLYLNTTILPFEDSILVLFFDSTNEAQATFEFKKKNAELQKLSVSCQLTGLYNRRYAINFLNKLKSDARHFGMLIFDLDHFKLVNDTHGHITGDEVLRYFASKVLKVAFRSSDAICRIGGEEFLVIFTASNRSDIERSAKRVMDISNNSVFQVRGKNEQIQVTASCGGSLFDPTDDYSFDQCLGIVDDAMYCVKRNGRNHYKVV